MHSPPVLGLTSDVKPSPILSLKINEAYMKNRILLIPFAFLLCFPFACQKQAREAARAPKASVEADVAAVKALIDDFVQLYNSGDFDRLMSVFYVEDAILMSPDVSSHKGKEAILLAYRNDDKLNIEHIESSVVEDVRVSGNLAVARGTDTGTTTPRSGGEPAKYSLKWLIVFERQSDGTWKCIDEIWNENPLPGTPKKERQE
jgi:ketosteroid isomerase-like protein